MEDLLIWTGLSVGFLGSFHCAGMCGPIALALPGAGDERKKQLAGKLAYNIGRTLTYSMMGAGVGAIGGTFASNGWQSLVSILSGVLILIVVLLLNQRTSMLLNSRMAAVTHRFKSAFGRLFRKKGIHALFLIGTVNGVLPCGFVYLALAGAATTHSSIQGAAYMALFGLGTVPMMLFISLSGSIISLSARRWINRLSPYVAIAMAIFLIHRGVKMHREPESCCQREQPSASPTH